MKQRQTHERVAVQTSLLNQHGRYTRITGKGCKEKQQAISGDHVKLIRRGASVKSDRRTRYTQRIIKEALLDLLNDQTLEKITVTSICDKAEVNRGTFYHHYRNVEHLFQQVVQEICFHSVTDEGYEFVDYDIFDQIFKYQGFYKELFRHSRYFPQVEESIHYVFTRFDAQVKSKTAYNAIEIKYELDFFMTGLLSLVRKWIEGNFEESPEKMKEIAANLWKRTFRYLLSE